MSLLKIYQPPSPRLRTVAEPIGTITDEIRALARNMALTMLRARGIGLAAPQVGRAIRLIVVLRAGRPLPLFNPTYEPVGERTVISREGCLSIPGQKVDVIRHHMVTVSALNAQGEPLSFMADGVLACCIQHEVDHLDGKLITDYAPGKVPL